MAMNKSRILVKQDGKEYHSMFHQYMIILMEYNPVSSELKRCFKMEMFAVPNMIGFMHVTHFLLNIIYPDTKEFKDCWPAFEKSQEKEFRNKATQMLRGIKTDFPNFQFPEIIPSRFLSPGGFWFIKVYWNLTVLAAKVQAERDLGCRLLHKPSGKLKEINKAPAMKLLYSFTMENFERLEKAKSSITSFMKDYNETKEYLFDQQKKYKSIKSQLKVDMDEDEFLSTIQGEEKARVLDSNDQDITIEISEQHKRLRDQEWKVYDSVNVEALKDYSRIIDAVQSRNEFGSNYVVNGHILENGDCSDILSSKPSGYCVDVLESIKPIRLLDYFTKPLEELRSMKLDKNREYFPFQLKEWERIHKEWEENKGELSRLELILSSKLAEIETKFNQEEDVKAEAGAAALESPKSILGISQDLCTSTPVPHQDRLSRITSSEKPSSEDFFDKTYRMMLAESAKRPKSINTESKPQPSTTSSTVDELRERLRKVQLSMRK